MKCHYCDGAKNTVPNVTYRDMVLNWYCKECERCTSVPHRIECDSCHKNFDYLYDPFIHGEYFIPRCLSCCMGMMKDRFNDPEFKEKLMEEIKRPMPEWLKKAVADPGWTGGCIPIPFVNKEKQ